MLEYNFEVGLLFLVMPDPAEHGEQLMGKNKLFARAISPTNDGSFHKEH